ncbi:hypothetical protein PIROE2DRAFT_1737 [Piromyces sp. E2]|nr:hypothetical protein PIROE2DRAFT_1737 [Piromyces sp. E2]|eukprot:OUM70063.1 hypothetical protein PIROE2DRAFT_1737 [Piromyces sp. E2]
MKFNYLLFLSSISLYISSTIAACSSSWVTGSCRKYFDEYYGDNKCTGIINVYQLTTTICSNNNDCYQAFKKGLDEADKCKINGKHTNDKYFKKCKKAIKEKMDDHNCRRS